MTEPRAPGKAIVFQGEAELAKAIVRARAGDAEAWGDLYRQYAATIFRFCRRALPTHEDAEDATVEIFMKLREKLGQYDPERPFSRWLYKVAANHCWDMLRRRHTRQDLETDDIGALVLISGIAVVIFAILLMIVGTGAGVATLMLYGPILYGSQVFVGSCVGEIILHKSKSLAPSVGALALGLLILRLLSNIPFLGFFVLVAILIWGTGAICMALWDRTRLDAAQAV